ncbi:MAG: hypothetical protein A2Y48_08005 [Nitrospirae bacterium RIFCSPLOW2_12_42_9]|nr:MAG: hypothetical protein A2Y48_08005 [Nitrospirae bacterium RIFCSPLOW2_12_42_9]HAS17203.1 hypothetical protein [Nitrospiraceae bacterium]HBI24046.1 hypothetical protein [Nitrospiraceae bacterium]
MSREVDIQASSNNIPGYVRLTGGDFFNLAMELGTASPTPPANICRLILHLDGHLDARLLREAVRNTGTEDWLANARWSRPIPFFIPRWKVNGSKNGFLIHENNINEEGPRELPRSVLSRKVSPFSPPAFAFDIIYYPSGKSSLVFTWHHALMDARGAEMLLTYIDRLGNGKGTGQPILFDRPPTLKEDVSTWLRFLVRSYFARKAIHTAARYCRAPIATIETTELRRGKDQGYRIFSFDREETALIDHACIRSVANFRISIHYLAATIRALDKVIYSRGCKPAAYVVPVPQDTRKRGSLGPVFGNQITFLFFRAEQEDISSMNRLVRVLVKQMTDQIRGMTPESFTTTMELFRNLPMGIFSLQAAGPTKGQIASLFFSFPGETCPDLDNFLNIPVLEALHLPPVSVPPGLSIIFNRYRGGISIVLSFVEGCLDPEELDLLEVSIRKELMNEDSH